MVRCILRVIIREHLAFDQLEMVYGIHNGGVDAAFVGALDEHPAVVMFLQRCLLEEGAQHILILHLAHAQDAYGTVSDMARMALYILLRFL